MARPIKFLTTNGTLRDRLRMHLVRDCHHHGILAKAWNLTTGATRQIMSGGSRVIRPITPERLNAACTILRLDPDERRQLHIIAAREQGWDV